MTPKKIISHTVLANMDMLAVTNPGLRDALEKALVFYELSGSPEFFDDDEEVLSPSPDENDDEEYEYDDYM